jgi:hypothetical protein
MEALTRYILDPANHDWLAVVKGLRNGIVYGAKVRSSAPAGAQRQLPVCLYTWSR